MSAPPLVTKVRDFLRDGLWRPEPIAPAPLEWGRKLLQFLFMVGEGFIRDQLILRAHALTYFTVLSLIPLLAIAVAVASAVGVEGGSLVNLVVERIAVGVKPEVASQIVELVEGVNFGGLGGLGAAALFGTTVLAIGTVEKAFNQIWGVKKQRPWVRRFPDYLAVLVVAPLLVGVAAPLAGTLRSQWVIQKLLEFPGAQLLYDMGLQYAPVGVLIVGFTFIFWFLPNTSVNPLAALLGGTVAGILFTFAQSLYVDLQVGVGRANALFGTFAALPLMMVWIYFSWAIALLGAEFAFAYQNLPFYRREVRGEPSAHAAREAVGLAIALELARAFRDGAEPWSDDDLAEALDVPVRAVRGVLSNLENAGLVIPVGNGPSATYLPGRPAARITVSEVLGALRGSLADVMGPEDVGKVVGDLLGEIDREELAAAAGRTLSDLLQLLPPRA